MMCPHCKGTGQVCYTGRVMACKQCEGTGLDPKDHTPPSRKLTLEAKHAK